MRALLDRLRRPLDRLRQHLVLEELDDDPRHVYGRPSTTETLVSEGEWSTIPSQPPTSEDPAPPRLEPLPRVWVPHFGESAPPLLQRRHAVWDIQGILEQQARAADAAGQPWLVVLVLLDACLLSERTLRSWSRLTSSPPTLLPIQPGNRLEKVWMTRLALGDARIELRWFPLTLCFEVHPTWLQLRSVALDAPGARLEEKWARLREGTSILAPGAEREVVRIWQQGQLLELSQANGFQADWRIPRPAGEV